MKRRDPRSPQKATSPEVPPNRTTPSPGPDRGALVLVALVAVAFVCRAVLLWQLRDHPLLRPEGVLDDAVYVQLARRVAAGDLGIGPEVYYLSPFYTYFVALVFALTGGSVLAVRVVQIALGAACVALIANTARRWFGGLAATVAGGLAAVTGLLAFYEVLLLQSAVDPFLTALALYALTRALQGEGIRWPLLAGVGLALLSLNRPNALPFVAVAGFGLAVVERSRAGLLRAGALLLAAAVTIAPVTVRNRVVAGEWVLISSHGGLNFFIGNNAEADGTYTFVEGVTPSIQGQLRDTKILAEKALGRPLSSSGVSSYFYDRAIQWMGAHPGDAAALFFRKLGYVFNSADLALNYSYGYFSRDEPTILPVLFVGPWLLLPLGLLGFVAWPRALPRALQFGVWASFVPVYALLVAAFFVSTRYRLPLLVPLCVTAGGGAVWLGGLARAGDVRRLAVPAVALIALAVMANRDVGPDTGRANQQTEMVLQFIGQGDVDRAERLLAAIEPTHPQRGLLLFRAGQAFAGRGDDPRAIRYLQRALEADPREPNINIVLGQSLVRVGRYADALPPLMVARDAAVSADEAGLALAGALSQLGRRREAREALERAAAATSGDAPAANWVALGLMAMRLEDPVAGERLFRRAVAADPGSGDAQENLGLSLILQGRVAEALAVLSRALEVAPSSPSVHYNLAVALAQDGRLAEAHAQAEEALRLRPDYPQALDMLRRLGAMR